MCSYVEVDFTILGLFRLFCLQLMGQFWCGGVTIFSRQSPN